MIIHEYQAKELLAKYQIPVPNGIMIDTPIDAGKAATTIGKSVVIKAQIRAGGRGKGGGIRIGKSSEEAIRIANNMLGTMLITHQTRPEGLLVEKVLVEEALEVKEEFYLSISIDRNLATIVILVSNKGGMEVEAIAEKFPEKLIKISIDPRVGLQIFQARQIALAFQLKGDPLKNATQMIQSLYNFFIDYDATLLEINPLVLTKDKRLIVADAKLKLDENAVFKHPELMKLRDINEGMPMEVVTKLCYVKLDGAIGCMVNGAGLAMATMDIIKLHGGTPANFLDIGGNASVEQVETAFKLLMADPDVKAILINIFGGIVRCDRVAKGVMEAAKRMKIDVPVVVRLAGTNCDIAEKILAKSSMKFIVAKCLRDATVKAIAASRGDLEFVNTSKPACL